MLLSDLRKQYHAQLCTQIIRVSTKPKKRRQQGRIIREEIDFPNFADGDSTSSVEFAWGIVNRIECSITNGQVVGQTGGARFETITCDFLRDAFQLIQHLRPGEWIYETQRRISDFDQYEHLARLDDILKENKELASALGSDYIITPDIVVARYPVPDTEINQIQQVVGNEPGIASFTSLRAENQPRPFPSLHASISCKWTIRSDRSQNTRTEALNLVRNRKGRAPHIMAVTAEPLPTRLAALALGTGDLDCVYHFALRELEQAVAESNNEDQLDMLTTLIHGRRLRDISDLPLDLAL
jgi:hypothetical protein